MSEMNKQDHKRGDDRERSPCFIIPTVTEKVEDFLPVKVITGVQDLTLLQPGVLASFENLRLLKMVSEYPDLFDEIDFVVMAGYPAAVYTEAFQQLIWAFDKLSFDQLVGELTAQKRIDSIQADQKRAGTPGSESKAKRFNSFDMHSGGDVVESEDDNPDEVH